MNKFYNPRIKQRQVKVNSGWHLYISKEYGKIWGARTENKDDGVYVRKIWFSKRKPNKLNKKPLRMFRGCKYARYMETEWGETKFINGLKNCTFRKYLEIKR